MRKILHPFLLMHRRIHASPLLCTQNYLLSSARTQTQREGMGLLEYQVMPSLRDVAHDKWLLTLLYNSNWKFHQLTAGQLLPGHRYGSEKRQAVRPVHHVQNNTCRVTLLQPGRQASVLGQPSSLRPHCSDPVTKLL